MLVCQITAKFYNTQSERKRFVTIGLFSITIVIEIGQLLIEIYIICFDIHLSAVKMFSWASGLQAERSAAAEARGKKFSSRFEVQSSTSPLTISPKCSFTRSAVTREQG